MNENLVSPIAYGRTAEIYAWHPDQVLKLFYDWFEIEAIEYELRIAHELQSVGLPVPHVGELIQVNGRKGLIYQRINGVSMFEMLSRKPWKIIYYARRMAELHARMHASTIQANIPPLHQKLKYKIHHAVTLPDVLRSKTLDLLEKMPQGDRLCHGDFHPGNIMVTEQGEVIIDWIDSALGNPMADLARTTIIIMGVIGSQTKVPFPKWFIRLFHRLYIRTYFSLLEGDKNEYSRWLPIVSAARLSENIIEMEPWLIAQVEQGL